MQQLSAMDTTHLYNEANHAPQHIAILSIYDPSTAADGSVSFEEIVANIERRLHLARIFRQKVVDVPLRLDHPYWVEDPDFDLEFHVRQTALAPPGGWEQLWRQAARSVARPLDISRPLWELEVIQGLDDVPGLPDDSFAVLLKVHHAAVDGLSGIEILNAIHDPTATTQPIVEEDRWQPEEDPSQLFLLGQAGINTAKKPLQLGGALVRLVPRVRRAVKGVRSEEIARPEREAPMTRFNGPVSGHRTFDGRRFSLAHIKRIKAAVPGTTVNDVALTIVGGALRAYLSAKDELPTASLRAAAPISIRTEAEQGRAGNQVSGMIVSLCTDVADPLERLAAVAEGAHNSKELTNAIGARTLTELSEGLPGALFGLASRAMGRVDATPKRPVINTVVSNVPGSQSPLYCCGARMTEIYGMGPIRDGWGLFHFLSSYCGEFTIATLSCPEMLPDPAFYGDCLNQSFQALRTAI